MTRIDFYQISDNETALEFACRLIDMIYRRGHQIHVHTGHQGAAEELDKLLWSWGDERFIPHELYEDTGKAKIKISTSAEPEDHQDVLINLSGKVPDFFSRFERVAEVVPVDQNSRDNARENYRFYKDRGYQLEYHQITAK
ncbi:MAG TPA: DNA polymerase III subunit chi [Gammaproteobacteria bacterium]|nr:DNA polymerase III subunit chi [Gammaproteobacteria bacterium]|tara:strand:- start:1691 stop:2113 length:423 start_codon:yes stop_codon:yes gene_type:complete